MAEGLARTGKPRARGEQNKARRDRRDACPSLLSTTQGAGTGLLARAYVQAAAEVFWKVTLPVAFQQ